VDELADLIALSTTFCKVAWQLQSKVRWWCYPGCWLRASVRKKRNMLLKIDCHEPQDIML
jgi:hypothetical protein